MAAHHAPGSANTTRRWFVWWLALALVVYGQSSSIVQMLGVAHRHAVVAQIEPTPWLDSVETVFRDIRAWRDGLHARWLPGEQLHSHPGEGGSSPIATHLHGAHAEPHTHTHFHSAFQRHHHDPQDPSVVTLDGNSADTLADASAQAGAGSATLTLGLAAALSVPSPAATPLAWQRAAPAAWADALPALLERPPRA